MMREHIDLTTVISDSDDSGVLNRTPRRGRQSQPRSQPSSRARKLASSPPPDRQVPSSTQDDHTSIRAATPIRSVKGSASKSASQDGKMPSLPVRSTGTSRSGPDVTPSSAHHHPPLSHRTPKNQTPKKSEWTTEKVEESLRSFSDEIGTDGAKLTACLIQMAWKREAPERRFLSKKDWFADMKRAPVEGTGKLSDTMRIRHKVCLRVTQRLGSSKS